MASRSLIRSIPSRRLSTSTGAAGPASPWRPFHIQARGEHVTDAVVAAGSQLLFFYAWQFDPAMSVKQLPGLGATDCTPWITALARANYRGYVNPFLHDQPAPDKTEDALARSRDYLEGVLPQGNARLTSWSLLSPGAAMAPEPVPFLIRRSSA